ncbi:uncharacterized protein LOC144665501 [Oculina patagonica]
MKLVVFVLTACLLALCDAKPPRPFLCPECDDCSVQSIKNKPCTEEDPVCLLLVSTKSSPLPSKVNVRTCYSRKIYEDQKRYCKTTGFCDVAICDTSGCKAEIPTSA